jgi:hypothetical protein
MWGAELFFNVFSWLFWVFVAGLSLTIVGSAVSSLFRSQPQPHTTAPTAPRFLCSCGRSLNFTYSERGRCYYCESE